jgi:serine/threonine-protein kinase RsbW
MVVRPKKTEEPSVVGRSEHSVASDSELIEIWLPATAAHLPVLRTFTADLAARLDFNLDEVADLRMAVDEACAGLVARAVAPTRLHCVFKMEPTALWVIASSKTADGVPPARDTFGWRVLTALVDSVDASASSETSVVTVTLGKWRGGDAT